MTDQPPWASSDPDPSTLTTAQLLRELANLREVLFTRLDGMDKATALLAETVNRTPTAIQTAISNMREVYDERFSSVQNQFAERDVRTDRAEKASKDALDAALLAQKESVSQQNDANTTKADKTEASFIKQIDQVGNLITALDKSWQDRFTELKERIDRGEGGQQGAITQRTEASTADRDALAAEQAKIAAANSRIQVYGLIIAAIVLALGVYAAFHH